MRFNRKPWFRGCQDGPGWPNCSGNFQKKAENGRWFWGVPRAYSTNQKTKTKMKNKIHDRMKNIPRTN